MTRRGSKAPASLHLVDLQLKLSLPDLRAPGGSLPFDFIPGAARNRSVTGEGVLTKALFVAVLSFYTAWSLVIRY